MALPGPRTDGAEGLKTIVRQRRPSRRQFLKGIGIGAGAVGLTGLGLVGWRASSQGVFSAGQGPAFAAWDEWDQGTGPLALVRAAVLSANPHNTQPWRFTVADQAIDMYVDAARNIGAIDPFRREQHIGLGCSLENLLIAGQAKGYAPKATVFPSSNDPTLIAHIELGSGPASNVALYQTIPRRHTHRAPFDASRRISQEKLVTLDQAVSDISGAGIAWITSDGAKRQIGQLIVEAAQAISTDPEQSAASFHWWRDSWSDVQRFKDGITLDTSGLSPLIRALAKILPPQAREQNDQSWIQLTRDQYVKTAAAFGVVVVRDAIDDAQRIEGGRLYQRLHLAAVNRGLAMQPLNQITERIDREHVLGLAPRFAEGLASVLAQPGWQSVMTFRIGYPTVEPPRSPRRPAEEVT